VNRNNGFALVTMLMVVAVVGILTAGSLILSVTNLKLTRNDATSSQALGVAQAGSAYWRAELVSLYMYMVENFDQYQDDIDAYNEANPSNQIACGNFFAIGVDLDRDGTPDVARDQALPAIEVPVGSQIGTAVVTFTTRGSAIVLDARGSVHGARARQVDEFRVSALDMWNNAVFAGNSAANATIQGRAEIRGSVHVLGTGLSSSDMALDLNGAFALGNTYRNLNSSIDPTGTDNPMRLTTRDPTDLCATLRVKRGYVNIVGSAQIGFSETTNPDPFIDPMRGIFTNDGIRGGTIDVNVHSANGMTAAYDAGNGFVFPLLDNLNPETGKTWRAGLTENALLLSRSDPSIDDRNVYAGVTEASAAHGEIYLTPRCFDSHPDNNSGGILMIDQAGQPTMVVKKGNGDSLSSAEGFVLKWGDSSDLPTPSFSCAKMRKNDFGPHETIAEIKWDSERNELYIGGSKGVVVLRDSLLITGPKNTGKETGYRGEGVLFAENQLGASGGGGGHIEMEFDLVPAPGGAAVLNPDGSAATEAGYPFRVQQSTKRNSYPATSILALVADKTVMSSGAQQRFTVAIYAEEYVYVTKQTLVVGSIVTMKFHAGSQVPTVLYVPNLAERLSDLLPGMAGVSYAVSNVAFSRR
jgi:type II secretory pathway pseudopilin PulG